GGALFGDRDVRTDPVADALTAELTSTAHGSGVVLVGCLGPVVVGYAAAHVETTARSSVSVVDDLYVEPEARGVGVGSALMDALVAHATRAGCSGIESAALPGDRATKNFFEGYGLVARKITVHRSLGADPTSQSAADG
ncbi:MAG: GNAT family N-acetyltransferase, partial [Actinobacteria bacterium]|nr:GNAT family N-acetyltransferase [Actinomycetota bacterium]